MIQKKAIIKSKYGLHARPSALISTTSSKFSNTEVWIINPANNKKIEASSILGLMMLELPRDSEVTIQAQGKHEEEAVEAIAKILETFEADVI